MKLEQLRPSASFEQILRHQIRVIFRRGGLINLAARPVFVLIWGLFCYWVVSRFGVQWLWLPALLNLYFALGLYRRYRLIEDTATSRLSSGAQGYVELEGRAWLPDGEAYRGLSFLPVTVWLPGYIESEPFYLADDFGRCLLYPQQAEIVTQTADNHLYWLNAIYPGQTLYALGDMRTLGGENMQLCQREQVSELLSEWKRRPEDLIEHFDQNNNGKLDPEEWQQVVASAQRLAREDIQEKRSQPGTHIIDGSVGGRLFMITNIPPDELALRYRVAAWVHGVVWLGLLMVVA
ncbi:MAG: EF-hand domain-containing protein [Thiolinea sp.]